MGQENQEICFFIKGPGKVISDEPEKTIIFDLTEKIYLHIFNRQKKNSMKNLKENSENHSNENPIEKFDDQRKLEKSQFCDK